MSRRRNYSSETPLYRLPQSILRPHPNLFRVVVKPGIGFSVQDAQGREAHIFRNQIPYLIQDFIHRSDVRDDRIRSIFLYPKTKKIEASGACSLLGKDEDGDSPTRIL